MCFTAKDTKKTAKRLWTRINADYGLNRLNNCFFTTKDTKETAKRLWTRIDADARGYNNG